MQEITTGYRVYPVGSTPLFNTTPLPETPPIIGENVAVADITATTAVLKGEVASDGGAKSVQRGFVYYTNPGQDPATGTEFLVGSGGVGEFSGTVSGLDGETTYYVRSFVRNGSGSSYSNTQIEFKTKIALKPILGSLTTSNITVTSVSVMSTVNNNGSLITRQGIIISPKSGVENPPLILDTNRTINAGLGSTISLTIDKLLPNTSYTVKAFAINGVDTSYSEPVSFTTSPINSPVDLSAPVVYNGSTYYVSKEQTTWSKAHDIALAAGGHLVTINGKEENSFVSTLAYGSYIWIGLSDSAKEGAFVWENGTSPSYTNWHSPPQPDNWSVIDKINGEDYVHMYSNGYGTTPSGKASELVGLWNDIDNLSKYAIFVIEFEN